MFELRPRQIEASDAGYNSLMAGKNNQFLYGCCGFGKSLVIADIAHRVKDCTLVLQPSVEILKQNYEKMLTYGIDDVTLYSAAANEKKHGFVTFATIQSIYKNPEEFKRYKYVIIDELHTVNPEKMETMYGKFLRAIGDPPRIGLTGTPFRTTYKFVVEKHLIGGIMEDEKYQVTVLTPLNRIINKKHKTNGGDRFVFGNLIFKAEMEELIQEGYLCRPNYDLNYSGAFDYTNLKMNTTGADFDQEALEAFVSEPRKIQQTVQACLDYDQKVNHNLIFCSSLAQAYNCSEYAKKKGLKADFLSGAHTQKQRKYLLSAFRGGDIKHLFNMNVLTTGYDFPGLDCVTFARPTINAYIWLQCAARVVRKDKDNPDKEAFIIDVAGVSQRLGRIETIRMAKEEVYKDCIVSEVGTLSGKPLSKFRIATPLKIVT